MSFVDDIMDVASGAWDFITGTSVGSNVVKTVLTGYALYKVTDMMKASDDAAKAVRDFDTGSTRTPSIDYGSKVTLSPAGENKVPIVYGIANVSGMITDANLSPNNKVMTFVVTLCERTGVKFSDGQQSVISFSNVFYNNNRIVFNNDGITASYMIDADGTVDRTIEGLIKVYCYNNGSLGAVVPTGHVNNSLSPAYSIMPGWTTTHTADNLVFAIVQVTYNKEKGVTTLPDISFTLNNNMAMPGDCLYDYMQSTRYGAGIDPTEIKYA